MAILSPRILLFNALMASIITLATGWLGTGGFASPGGFLSQSYGFPLPWKTTFASCPPPCIQANGTQYDWILFTCDLIFYLTAGYCILLYLLRSKTQPHRFKARLESVRVLGILGLAVIALSLGNYAYDSVYGTGNNWSGYGMLALDHYSFQKANLLTIWLKDIGPGTASANSLYIKSANGGPVASYALNLTIDQGSLGMISENTTSQGLQLTQSSTYNLQITEGSGAREYTFTVTWT